MEPEAPSIFPLQRCLCCGYSLTGLPTDHQCPECGLEYDPHSHAVELNPPPTTFSMVAGFLSWIVVAAVVVNNARNLTVSVLVGAALIGLTAHYLIIARHGRRLIINNSGMHMASRRRLERSIPWDTIAGFEFSRVDGGLVARTTAGNRVKLCPDPKLAKVCRQSVEWSREVYMAKRESHSGSQNSSRRSIS